MHYTANFSRNKIIVYERGHSVSSMARAIGIQQSTASRTLDGINRNAQVQQKIADFLRLSPVEVFGDFTSPKLAGKQTVSAA